MSTGKILITGATGDTGGYMIEQLLQKKATSPRPSSTASTAARSGWKTRAWR